jgi:hypothetical protein
VTVLRWFQHLRCELRRMQLREAVDLLALTNEAREAEKKPHPIGWTSWPPLSGGASRTAATLRPPSASRWK